MVSGKKQKIIHCLDYLREATRDFPPTMTRKIVQDYGKDPYLILISCLLSLRARDTMTYPVSKRLFELARTPQKMTQVPREKLEELLHPLGFFRTKALRIQQVSRELLDRFNGSVPRTLEELLSLKGVGRKTANLVLGAAFDIPSICVDTHVHRLANKWGWISTKNEKETEKALKEIVPKERWGELNELLVLWGQNRCKPYPHTCRDCEDSFFVIDEPGG